MAYTKMWAIKERLDTVINYIENEDKTIDKALNYVTRNEATENQKYVTCINCNASDPYESMYNTKKLFHNQKKRIAYHAVQSFQHGEGDADTIREIGVKLATELYGDEYEIVVTTHLDKDHLHNHILINSTSFIDGHHFTNSKADRKKMIEVSDRLCKEYELNVIENTNSKYKNHNSFKAKFYIRDIKKSMNDITQYTRTMTQFIQYMGLEGYEFKSIDDVDCIIHPGFTQPIPLSILGKNYSLDSIKDKILEVENFGKEKQFYSKEEVNNLYFKFKNHQLKGILLIYVDFQIKLGIIPSQRLKGKQKLSKECRKQLKKLDLITYETTLMNKLNLHSLEDLSEYKQQIQQDYNSTIKIKNQLYQKGYRNHNLVEGSKQIEESKSYQPKINELRKQIKVLEDIEIRSLTIQKITIQEKEKQKVR